MTNARIERLLEIAKRINSLDAEQVTTQKRLTAIGLEREQLHGELKTYDLKPAAEAPVEIPRVGRGQKLEATIIMALKKFPGISANALRKSITGGDFYRFKVAMKNLEKKGIIKKIGSSTIYLDGRTMKSTHVFEGWEVVATAKKVAA